jgi:hypothetical protein
MQNKKRKSIASYVTIVINVPIVPFGSKKAKKVLILVMLL